MSLIKLELTFETVADMQAALLALSNGVPAKAPVAASAAPAAKPAPAATAPAAKPAAAKPDAPAAAAKPAAKSAPAAAPAPKVVPKNLAAEIKAKKAEMEAAEDEPAPLMADDDDSDPLAEDAPAMTPAGLRELAVEICGTDKGKAAQVKQILAPYGIPRITDVPANLVEEIRVHLEGLR